ncbi:MAG: hypothetical protein KKI08_11145 [Armatimonadetes bacterium]|nr:hypothetical protein [Armatimonadota bacterium]
MKDDDLDLELDDEPVRREPRPAPAPTAPVKPAATAAVTAAKAAAPAEAGKRPGWLGGLLAPVAWIRDFRWTVRNFLSILIALVVLVVLIENWVPVRCYALGFAFEMPRTVTFVIDLVIGALLMWLWLRRPARGAEDDQ